MCPTTTNRILFRSLAGFRSRVFAVLDCARSATGDRSSRWQPWNVEAASCLGLFTTYVWWKTEASSGAIVRPPGSSGGGMKGVKGPALSSAGAPWFTVDDIFSLALVGAYRTTAPDNGGLAWHFVSNYCPRGRSFLSRRSDRSSAERDNALFYSALFLFCFACLRFFFFAALFFGSRSLFVAPSRDVDAYPPEFRGSRGTDLSSQLRQK